MASPLDAIRHEAARRAALAIAGMLSAVLKPDEQVQLSRMAFEVVKATIEEFERQKASLN